MAIIIVKIIITNEVGAVIDKESNLDVTKSFSKKMINKIILIN